MSPKYSILTDAGDYPGANNSNLNPAVVHQYCNGSRIPPEAGGIGITVPPGIADTVLPNPLFSLMPSATPDEGNQWINMSYGPLSLFNEALTSGSAGYNALLGNYTITAASPAINHGTPAGVPNHDIFGTRRPQGAGYDIGAVEFVQPGLFGGAPIYPLALGSQPSGLLGLLQGLVPNAAGNLNLPGGLPTLPVTPPAVPPLAPAQTPPARGVVTGALP
jgi:hypothetical protein